MAYRSTVSVSLLALAGALALAGCSKTDTGATNAAEDNLAAPIDNEAAAVPPEDLPLPEGDNAVVEDESTAPAIQVAGVPTPAPSTPAADSAPLTDAIAAEQMIDAGTGITRVQQADGWAWMKDGQIIRTASADGKRVSYFRRGSSTPYLVQQNGRSYAYDNGRVTHEYDDHGRPGTPTAQHQREAWQVAEQAHQLHDRAQQASKTAPHVDRSRDRDDQRNGRDRMSGGDRADGRGPSTRPQPSPSPSPSPATDHGSRDQDRGSNSPHNTGHNATHPSPSPSPSPSAHGNDSRHTSGDRTDRRGSRDDDRQDNR